ncbi:hypothetical protein LINPERPRIM_LOCUS14605 [Linum perenne]
MHQSLHGMANVTRLSKS